jgi:hypothetical protein
MLATGTATASMARGGGPGEGFGGGRGYHASGRHGLDRHGFNRRGFTDPDMYGDYFCESPYPYNRYYGVDGVYPYCQ